MRCIITLTLLWLSARTLYAQNGTEIYVLALTEKAGQLSLSEPRNVSTKPGYDNQPFFHPDQPVLYYTSMMADGQTDIWSYHLRTGMRTQITHTPDSEYSPTVWPGQQHLSCIVQRKANGDQDLVKYSLTNPVATTLIVESQKSGKVGYQAWLNTDEAVLFILGEPNSLHYRNTRTGRDTIIATNIGRSLHCVPGEQAFSFVQQVAGKWMVRAYYPALNQVRDLAKSHVNSDHYNAWVSSRFLLESRGDELWAYDLVQRQWQAVRLPAEWPHKKLSRIAVMGKQVALVVDE